MDLSRSSKGDICANVSISQRLDAQSRRFTGSEGSRTGKLSNKS